MPDHSALVLKFSGPLQSWGSTSRYNQRCTDAQPTKSGVVGLLAAAEGRRRGAPLDDLTGLAVGVRVDQPGSILVDYHTAADFRGEPLLAAAVNAKGKQRKTSPKKFTAVTTRQYLQDAVFVVAVSGTHGLIRTLAEAVSAPKFPLSLGRRSCVPAGKLLVNNPNDEPIWTTTASEPNSPDLKGLLEDVPWQASSHHKRTFEGQEKVGLSVTVDDPAGLDIARDVPLSFASHHRGMLPRSVKHHWVNIATGFDPVSNAHDTHEPFSLLGG